MDTMTQAITSVVTEALTGWINMQSLFYFGTAFLGLLAHFLKGEIKGQRVEDIKNYFQNHLKDTILGIIATIVSLAVASQTGDLTYVTAFMAGYICDSLFATKGIIIESNNIQGEPKAPEAE